VLTPSEEQRYDRQMRLGQLGVAGQLRLKNARVLVVGAGGLGCPILQYLAAAGVGTLIVIDPDIVSLDNLHRQILYGDADIGRAKAVVAVEKLSRINPHCTYIPRVERFSATNAKELLEMVDVVVDGSDNFATRYIINDSCVLHKTPLVFGCVQGFEGQVAVFAMPKGPCYRCLFPVPPPAGAIPDCATAGVLGVLPGLIGLWQANETLKIIVGYGEPLSGYMLLIDLAGNSIRRVKLSPDPACSVCGTTPSITSLHDQKISCSVQPQRTTPMNLISVRELAQQLKDQPDNIFLLDVREPFEWELCHLEAACLVPLGNVPENLDKIPRDRFVAVMCKAGGRSARAVEYLQSQGYGNIANVTGGILAWGKEIDPSMPAY